MIVGPAAQLPDPWRAYVVLIPLAAIVLATVWLTRRIWRQGGGGNRLAIFVLGSVTAWLVSVRVPLHTLGTGVDGSFPHVLNHLAFSATVFGRDVIYTYGPLGWLLVAEQVNDHLLLACVFWATLYLCTSVVVVACCVCFAAGPSRVAALLCSLSVLWLVDVERLLPCLCFLLVVIGYQLPKLRLPMLLLGSVLAAVALTIKFSGGVICGVTLASSALLPFSLRATAGRLLVVGAGFAGSFVVLWVLIYGSLAGGTDYFVRSLQVSEGYTASMASGRTDEGLLLGMFLTVIAAVFALGASLRGQRVHAILVLAGPVFIAWKHGVVRFDAHAIGLAVTSMFLALAWVLASLAAGVTARSFALRVGVLVMIAVLLDRSMVQVVGRTQDELPARIGVAADALTPLPIYTPLMSCRAAHAYTEGFFELAALAVDWDVFNDRMRADGVANTASFRLPDEILAAIGSASVDFYSMDLSFLAANDLDYRPKPMFQHFNAFTPELDRWNAEFFRSEERPDFLICHAGLGMASIDRRHLLFDDPVAQVAILDHYQGYDPGRIATPASVLLRRTDRRRFDEPDELGGRVVRVGETIPVPSTAREGVLRARIGLERSIYQRAKQAVFRLSPLRLTYNFRGGGEETYRLMPLHLADGVWVEPYFPNVSDYYEFMARAPYGSATVESIRVTADDAADYPATLAVTWELIPERQPGLRRRR